MATEPKRTNKPCPGCGGTAPWHWQRKEWRLETEVCHVCKDNLAYAAAVKKRNAVLDDRKVYRFSFRGWALGKRWTPEVKDLREAWNEILKQFLPGIPAGRPYQPCEPGLIGGEFDTYAEADTLLTEAQVAAIKRMGAAMDAALTAVNDKALDHGRNLLAQLAQGEISVADLNEGESAESIERRRESARRGMLG